MGTPSVLSGASEAESFRPWTDGTWHPCSDVKTSDDTLMDTLTEMTRAIAQQETARKIQVMKLPSDTDSLVHNIGETRTIEEDEPYGAGDMRNLLAMQRPVRRDCARLVYLARSWFPPGNTVFEFDASVTDWLAGFRWRVIRSDARTTEEVEQVASNTLPGASVGFLGHPLRWLSDASASPAMTAVLMELDSPPSVFEDLWKGRFNAARRNAELDEKHGGFPIIAAKTHDTNYPADLRDFIRWVLVEAANDYINERTLLIGV